MPGQYVRILVPFCLFLHLIPLEFAADWLAAKPRRRVDDWTLWVFVCFLTLPCVGGLAPVVSSNQDRVINFKRWNRTTRSEKWRIAT